MPFQKGHAKIGGRKRGSQDYATRAERACAEVGVDPFVFHAQVVKGDVPCNVCRGTGKTRYQAGGKFHERRCESCYGSGKERINPRDRIAAAAILANKIEGNKQTVEHTGPDGGAIQHSVRMNIVKAKRDGD